MPTYLMKPSPAV